MAVGLDAQRVLEKVLNGVAVVSSRKDGKINGLTVAWMTQVSYQPPLIAVSIGKARYTHEMIESSRVFAVSILHEGQLEVAKLFGLQSGRDLDKFAHVAYETRVSGSPILKDCLAFLDCEVDSSLQVGDHTIFVGRILDAGVKGDMKPLIYNPEDYW
ncbi:MAG: flavin reductase family protein [Candidatus Bathyarchaeia archaeon]